MTEQVTDEGTEKRGRGRPPAAVADARAPQPHRARQYARRRFAQELPRIFETYAKAAAAGDIASLKALMTLVGFDREDAHVAPARKRKGKSLAQILLEDLKKNPPPPVTREPGDWEG